MVLLNTKKKVSCSWKFQSFQSWWPLQGIKTLSADSSLKKINLGFPQQQNSICFHVRSNGISEGHIDFIQISEKITAGQIHQRCQNTQAQVSEPQSCALGLGTEGAQRALSCTHVEWNQEVFWIDFEDHLSIEPWHLEQGYKEWANSSILSSTQAAPLLCKEQKDPFYPWEHVSKKCFPEGGLTVLGTQSHPAGKAETEVFHLFSWCLVNL